jgi:hypothetical protein
VVAAIDALDGDGWVIAGVLEAHPAARIVAMIKNDWKCNREDAKSAKTDAKNEIFFSDLRALRAFASIIEFRV